jgi:hypothetical protein
MLAAVRQLASKFFTLADKELSVLEELHGATSAAIERLEARDPDFRERLAEAYAYAVFPSVGKATAVVGAAFGKGEVFQGGKLIGYAALGQLTLGVQLGGQTFDQVILFRDKAALDRFKSGRFAFAANASAVLVKAGAAGSAVYERGVAAYVSSEGGMMLEAAIGAQKFFFRPAVIGRTRRAGPAPDRANPRRSTIGKSKSTPSEEDRKPPPQGRRAPRKVAAIKKSPQRPRLAGG